jgi:hypothetical protein
MDDAARRAIYLRLTWRKLILSKVSWGAGAALILFAAVFWMKDSLETAFKAFLTLCPYLFLFLTQDMMKGEIDAGSLENVLFINGGFRSYLKMKNLVVAGAAVAFVSGVFVVLAVPAVITGTFAGRKLIPLFLLAAAAGVYYVFLGNALSLFLKGGSNVMIVIIVQAALAVWLILSVKDQGGILTYLETGTFPNFGARLLFMGFAALCPNFLISVRFVPYSLEFLLLAAALWLVQSFTIGRLELVRR